MFADVRTLEHQRCDFHSTWCRGHFGHHVLVHPVWDRFGCHLRHRPVGGSLVGQRHVGRLSGYFSFRASAHTTRAREQHERCDRDEPLTIFQIASTVLAVYAAAYCTELVRAAILAVPSATRRASRSLGLTYLQDLREIVFPIAGKVFLPNWISLTLAVMKDTSLVLWIGVMELLRAAQSVVTRTDEPLFVLAITGLIYFAMGFPIAHLGTTLEKKWLRHD